MNENYCALYIAIIKNISIDAALRQMDINVRVGRKHNKRKKPMQNTEYDKY